MNPKRQVHRPIALIIILLICLPQLAFGVDKKKKPIPKGTPVLWREPHIASRNLFLGPGGAGMRPNLRRLKLIREEEGYSPKFRVRDASGRGWVAKLGKEAQSETTADHQ